MTISLADAVAETANSPGVNTFQLAGPPAGRVSFVQGGLGGKLVPYLATDGTQIEVGYGTVTAGTPNLLSRDHVDWNTRDLANGPTALNFIGAVTVYCALTAERALWRDENGALQMGTKAIAGVAAASAADQAVNLGQLGAERLFGQTIAAQVATLTVPLPATHSRFRLLWDGLVCGAGANAVLSLQFSFDGGTTFSQGAYDYAHLVFTETAAGGRLVQSQGNATSITLSPVGVAGEPFTGDYEFTTAVPGYGQGNSRCTTITGTGIDANSSGSGRFYSAQNTRPNALRLVGYPGGLASGDVALLGLRNLS